MKIRIFNFPKDKKPETEEYFRDDIAERMSELFNKFKVDTNSAEIDINISGVISDSPPSSKGPTKSKPAEYTDSPDISTLVAPPRSNSHTLCLSGEAYSVVQNSLHRLAVKSTVYEDWGISAIDPFPRLSLNFSGPPGTGKTLAAHYIAKELNKTIIEVSYADIVSKYFGQGAKNLVELFRFATTANSILFIDEAETLLSRRNSSQSDGADHAINSMRSQLLILLERTPIISIFATNLIESYDPAFKSRLLTVKFELPDEDIREKIWAANIPKKLPTSGKVTPSLLANRYTDLNGREISRSVIEAAHRAAINKQDTIMLEDFDWAVEFVKANKD